MKDWNLFVPDTMPAPILTAGDGCCTLTLPEERMAGFVEKDFTGLAGEAVKIHVETDADPGLNNRVGAVMTLVLADGTQTATVYLEPSVDKNGKLVFDIVHERMDAVKCNLSLYAKWFVGSVTFSNVTVEDAPAVPVRKARIVTTRIWPPVPSTCEKNIQIMKEMLERISAEVEHPDLVLFSEGITDRFDPRPLKERSEPADGPTFQMYSEWAKKNHCYVATTIHEIDNDRVFNTAILVGRNGELVGKYRKNHLTWGESRMGITPGWEFPVFELDFGKVGIQTCWDCWFPESARALRLNGAEVILLPIAGDGITLHRDHVWAARALENGVYMVTSTTFASHDGVSPSRIYAPSGEIIAQMAEPGRYAWADITLPFHDWCPHLSVGPSRAEPRNIYIRERNVEADERLTKF